MALTNAERQASYRERNRAAGVDAEYSDRPMTERLSAVIELSAKRNLERMAAWRRVTQRQLLEELINTAEQEMVNELSEGERREFWRTTDQLADQRTARHRQRIEKRAAPRFRRGKK